MNNNYTEIIKQISKEKSNLIKALQLIQQNEGYISNDSIKTIAEYFNLAPVEVEGVVSFYTQFKRQKPGKYHILICDGTACHIKGSKLIKEWIDEEINLNNKNEFEGLFSVEIVACLGCCSLAPVISINGKVYGKLDRKSLIKILKRYKRGEIQ
ncbi:MAG: NAD(P)H-dependent oxidoreductase subunit E [Candidatus Marinimicrobia bacterium]|nr:NAD(P)H-dependent oxidoreductase subunit E [Candidatus Neomarinimicrobiota bacterium]